MSEQERDEQYLREGAGDDQEPRTRRHPIPSRHLLIGYGGPAGSGKDASADHLVDRHGFTKLNMSDPLLAAMLILDPIIPAPGKYIAGAHMNSNERFSDLHKIFGYVETKKHPEVRRLLQQLGTEFGRKVLGEDTWVNIAARRIIQLREAAVASEDGNVAITGIRYRNELEMIHRLGGTSVWVKRPSLTGIGALSAHSSENSLSEEDFDATLLNDGSLGDLELATTKMFTTLNGRVNG